MSIKIRRGKMEITVLQCDECGGHVFGAATEEESYSTFLVLTCTDCGGSIKYQTIGEQL